MQLGRVLDGHGEIHARQQDGELVTVEAGDQRPGASPSR
jgi:hypothetical protein